MRGTNPKIWPFHKLLRRESTRAAEQKRGVLVAVWEWRCPTLALLQEKGGRIYNHTLGCWETGCFAGQQSGSLCREDGC